MVKQFYFYRIRNHLYLLLLVMSFNIYGQKEVVKISIENKRIEGSIPFDEDFTIKGAADKDVLSISFKYRVKGGMKSNQYWPEVRDDAEYSSPASQWNGVGDEYFVDCGRLHPNVMYEFHFTIKRKITVDDVKRKEINQAIINQLKIFFSQRGINEEKIKALRTTLNNTIKASLNLPGKLVDTNGNEFSIGPFVPPLKSHVDNISRLVSQIDSDSQVIAKAISSLEIMKPVTMDPIENILSGIYNGRIKLGTSAIDLLKRPIDPSNKEFASVDGNEFLEFFVRELSSGNEILKLLQGAVRIEGKRLVRADKRHLPSIELLTSFVQLLQNRFFTLEQTTKERKASKAPVQVFSTSRQDKLLEIQRELEMHIIKMNKAILKNKTELYDEINHFPDLLLNTFIEQEFQVFEQPTIDVISDKNPYVGLDVGLVVAPGIESAFAYWGLNCYLVPVNKSAPLSIYKGRDRFLKKFSIYMGFTNNISSKNYDRYEDLINDNGSMLVGCGWRFTRALRGNVGGLLYLEKDQNPVVDDSKLALTPTISLSLDINIAKAFGDITKLFLP